MIIKRIKVRTMRRLRETIDYSMNEEKTKAAKKSEEVELEVEGQMELNLLTGKLMDNGVGREQWISSRICPVHNFADFMWAKAEQLNAMHKIPGGLENGILAYILIQSFPLGLEITEEEVHQCGVELAEKLGPYPALVCSHVAPMVDKDGVERGRQYHNHILISAFKDPKHYMGGPTKFPNELKTLDWIKMCNDQVAIEHNLPIIRNPDNKRHYSWYQDEQARKGKSWVEQLRTEIALARFAAVDWDDFCWKMDAKGYRVEYNKGGKVVYVTAEGKRIQEDSLGRPYTRKGIREFWQEYSYKPRGRQDNEYLADMVYSSSEPLYAKIMLGPSHWRAEDRKYGMLALSADTKIKEDTLRTYFDLNEEVEICNAAGQCVRRATGFAVVQCMADLKDRGWMAQHMAEKKTLAEVREEQRKTEQEKREQKRKEEQEDREFWKKFYRELEWKKYYLLWHNEEGHRLPWLFSFFYLILIMLDPYHDMPMPKDIELPEGKNEPLMIEYNWKLKLANDCYIYCQEEDVRTPEEAERRAETARNAFFERKKEFETIETRLKKTKELREAIEICKRTELVKEQIDAAKSDAEKDRLKAEYAELFLHYDKARICVWNSPVRTEQDIRELEITIHRLTSDFEDVSKALEFDRERMHRLNTICRGAIYYWEPNLAYGVDHLTKKAQEEEQKQEQKSQSSFDARLRDVFARAAGQTREKKKTVEPRERLREGKERDRGR